MSRFRRKPATPGTSQRNDSRSDETSNDDASSKDFSEGRRNDTAQDCYNFHYCRFHELLEEFTSCHTDSSNVFDRHRPDKISLTTRCRLRSNYSDAIPPLDKYLGATLGYGTATDVIRIASLNAATATGEEGLLVLPELFYSEEGLGILRVGDILESINDFQCRNQSLEDVEDYLWSQIAKEMIITFVFLTNYKDEEQKAQTEDSIMMDALGHSNISSNNSTPKASGVLCRSIFLPPNLLLSDPDAKPYQDKLNFCDNFVLRFHTATSDLPVPPLKTNRDMDRHDNPYLPCLQVARWIRERLPSSFDCVALQEGHFVVTINDNPTLLLSAESTEHLLRAILSPSPDHHDGPLHPYVSFLSLAPPLPLTCTSPPSRLRRACIAAAGGSLTMAGAALMVTPLHPIGHAMAWGGVVILGREFKNTQSIREDQDSSTKEGSDHGLGGGNFVEEKDGTSSHEDGNISAKEKSKAVKNCN